MGRVLLVREVLQCFHVYCCISSYFCREQPELSQPLIADSWYMEADMVVEAAEGFPLPASVLDTFVLGEIGRTCLYVVRLLFVCLHLWLVASGTNSPVTDMIKLRCTGKLSNNSFFDAYSFYVIEVE